ncbi:MAG: hypothetical protein FD181_3506 [Prolixibacteraceae bacterium]|nr:MAG: hypothetical protein FD181_3506 [Prolixibacteraceae bacterium]
MSFVYTRAQGFVTAERNCGCRVRRFVTAVLLIADTIRDTLTRHLNLCHIFYYY